MRTSTPVRTDVVLLGGGHSHVAVLKRFGMHPAPGVRLTLLARDVLTPYSGMLPGLVAGHYSHAEAHVDLQRLCRFAGARLYHAPANGIDLARQEVSCEGRPAVPFDLLSIDIGSAPRLDAIDGADAHALPVKPVDRFLERWPALESACADAGGRMRFVTIGGGAGGVELTLSLQHRLRAALAARAVPDGTSFTIVSEAPVLLPGHAPGVARRLATVLSARGVRVLLGTRAVGVTAQAVHCDSGEVLDADATIVVTHAGPARWLTDTGLALDDGGFVRVGPTLQSESHPMVFAAGDVGALSGHRLAKSGVFAVRQGPVLAENLRRMATGGRLRAYRPQARALALISSGDRCAIASYGDLSLAGGWVWRLKDWIDRRWMRGYQALPAMGDEAREEPGGDAFAASSMRCGGCGSKVASAVLHRALARLELSVHPDVVVGLAGADDAAVVAVPAGKLLVQSVDHFRTFIDDPYVFGRVTANHCLSDLYAMGASPHTAQVMVSLPFGTPGKVEDDLIGVLTGVCEALAEAGAALVGGHTAEGPELSLGLAVNGLVDAAAVLRKGGSRAGDALVLTKPLGTGVVFAADMRAEASAASVAAALAAMQQSNRSAAACVAEHGATACTDVTGFGLAGHLVEMLNASALDARLALASIPVLKGAAALMRAGVRSSLHPANAAFAERVDAGGRLANGIDPTVLYDPQTSGGLLASVPAERAEACVAALRALGYAQAAVIGNAVAPADPAGGRIFLG